MLQRLAEFLEDLLPCVGAIVRRQLFQRVGLCGLEERPQLFLGDKVRGIRDVRLRHRAVAVLAGEVIRDVLLKGQLGSFLLFSHVEPTVRVVRSKRGSAGIPAGLFPARYPGRLTRRATVFHTRPQVLRPVWTGR